MAEAVAQLTGGWRCWRACPTARAAAARARAAARAGSGVDRREGLRGAGDRPRLRPGPRAVPGAGRRARSSFRPCTGNGRSTSTAASWPRRTEVGENCCAWPKTGSDAAARVTGHRILGSSLFHLGELLESRTHLEKGLALYDPVRDRSSAFRLRPLDSRVVCLLWLVRALFALGYPEQAGRGARGARLRPGARPSVHDGCRSSPHWQPLPASTGPGNEVLRRAEALIALATEQGFPLFGGGGHGRRRMGAGRRRATPSGGSARCAGPRRLPGHRGRAVGARTSWPCSPRRTGGRASRQTA